MAEFLHSILSLPAVASNNPPLMVLCNKQVIINHDLISVPSSEKTHPQDVGVAKGESVIKSLLEKEVDKVNPIDLR